MRRRRTPAAPTQRPTPLQRRHEKARAREPVDGRSAFDRRDASRAHLDRRCGTAGTSVVLGSGRVGSTRARSGPSRSGCGLLSCDLSSGAAVGWSVGVPRPAGGSSEAQAAREASSRGRDSCRSEHGHQQQTGEESEDDDRDRLRRPRDQVRLASRAVAPNGRSG